MISASFMISASCMTSTSHVLVALLPQFVLLVLLVLLEYQI